MKTINDLTPEQRNHILYVQEWEPCDNCPPPTDEDYERYEELIEMMAACTDTQRLMFYPDRISA